MAAYHVHAMQEQRPHGPYVLGGYCVGATLAGEMARQLAEKGENVAHLLLIDPPLWGTPWFRWVWPCVNQLGDVLQWDLQRKIYYFDRYCVSFSRWLKRSPRAKLTTMLRRLGIKLPEAPNPFGTTTAPQESGDMEILNSTDYAVYIMAYRLYRPQPWIVPTTLFFPESTPPGRVAEVRRRSRAASLPFGVAVVPGDHHTCITKHTPGLVAAIRKALEEDHGVDA
jgi:hypothetical protein